MSLNYGYPPAYQYQPIPPMYQQPNPYMQGLEARLKELESRYMGTIQQNNPYQNTTYGPSNKSAEPFQQTNTTQPTKSGSIFITVPSEEYVRKIPADYSGEEHVYRDTKSIYVTWVDLNNMDPHIDIYDKREMPESQEPEKDKPNEMAEILSQLNALESEIRDIKNLIAGMKQSDQYIQESGRDNKGRFVKKVKINES